MSAGGAAAAASNSNGNWCLIESDPAVGTELIEMFGVNGLRVKELYTLEDLQQMGQKDVYGLIFLFKYTKGIAREGSPYDNAQLFFANQIITNACATMALLHILLNNVPKDQLGSTLKEFKEFTQEFDAQMKGLAISNSDTLRASHNSFARQDAFIFDPEGQHSSNNSGDEDVFHFVSYIPFQGELLELDGLQETALSHGKYQGNWLDSVKPVIERRIQSYVHASNQGKQEIRFNLMAVVTDPCVELQKRLQAPNLSDFEKQHIQEQLSQEEDVMKKIRKENARRRFNFIPLIFKLLENVKYS
jgi:ubiquitin carboxyl-terminal hydrolase L5